MNNQSVDAAIKRAEVSQRAQAKKLKAPYKITLFEKNELVDVVEFDFVPAVDNVIVLGDKLFKVKALRIEPEANSIMLNVDEQKLSVRAIAEAG